MGQVRISQVSYKIYPTDLLPAIPKYLKDSLFLVLVQRVLLIQIYQSTQLAILPSHRATMSVAAPSTFNPEEADNFEDVGFSLP